MGGARVTYRCMALPMWAGVLHNSEYHELYNRVSKYMNMLIRLKYEL